MTNFLEKLSVSQQLKMFLVFMQPMVHHHFHKSLSLKPIPIQSNPVNTFLPYFSIKFLNYLSSYSSVSHGPLPLRFPNQNNFPQHVTCTDLVTLDFTYLKI